VNFFRKVTAKPWEHAGETDGLHGEVILHNPSKRVALRMFLAVISSMFFLFMVAYRMRMHLGDWQSVPLPDLLWINTLLLLLGSVVLHYARIAANNDNRQAVKNGLLFSGLLTMGFLAGQVMAWNQMEASGYFMRGNPAAAFFYLLTGVHALHVAGGLWVWARATFKVWRGESVASVRLSVQLCSTYWHYLLLIWLIMFYLLMKT
jgi:cytochrome c oxidase subunit 3